MNLRHLRTFVTIVDAGGVARAAARLNMTQPTASRQIEALEAELGVPLFDRIGRRVQLTSEGEDLLQRSRRLLADADSLGERARSLKAGEIGILRVGATPGVIESLLGVFLTRYRRRHPGVETHVVSDVGDRLDQRLERSEVHLAITTVGTGFESRLLYPMHLIAALSRARRPTRRTTLEIAELADEPVLLLPRGSSSRGWFEAACQAAHVRPRIVSESAAPQTLVALAAKGHGVAILPSNVVVPRGIARGVPLVHRGASIGRWGQIAWDPRRSLAPYAKQFVAELVAHCRRDYPGRVLIKHAPPLPRPDAGGG